MVRANPAAGDEWAPHPKVEVLPLGMGLDFKPVWPFAEVFDIFKAIARTPRDELIISRMSSHGIRSLVKEQLQLAHPDASQQQSYGVDYRTDLASAVFIASPPGFGADCYRHYEALAMGAIPVANAHSVSLTALRTLPSLVVDDFAQADRATLDAAHAQDAVGVDVERHVDLRHALGHGRERPELEGAEQVVVLRELSLAFVHGDADVRLMIASRREGRPLPRGHLPGRWGRPATTAFRRTTCS